jgi:type I restriction enzyme S subunit
LPQGWAWTTVGDTGEYINGYAFKPGHREDNGRPIIRIQNLTDPTKALNRTTLAVPTAYHVATGEMLVSWSATVDVFVWTREPALVNQHIFRVVPNEGLVDKTFLFHWLKVAIDQLLISEHLHGSTMKHINRGPFMAHRIPLPPRPEQERIAQALEELLSDLDAGVAELKAAQRKLAQYRQSLLKAAVEGALTADWRAARARSGEPQETGADLLQRILTERRARWEAKQLAKYTEQGKTPPNGWQAKCPEPTEPSEENHLVLPTSWTWATVDQISIAQKYGSSSKTGEDASGVPVLRMGNIQDGRLDLTNLKYLPEDHQEFPDLLLEDGDLLFNRTNSPELVGKTAVYRSEITPCSYASYLIGVKLNSSCCTEFVAAFINSAFGRAWVKEVVTQQVGQANVNGSKLASLTVPLPPRDEQQEIIARLDDQLRASFHEQAMIERGLEQAAAQRKNILKAAFAGQLVRQNPNDEPASALLARIRAECANETVTAKPRSRKPRTTA